MANFTVDCNELEQGIDNFLQNTLKQCLKQGMEKACLVVERDAKKNCPVDVGRLRDSIEHDVDVQDSTIEGYVGTNVEYAPYVHEGTGIYTSGGRNTPWFYYDDGKLIRTVGQQAQPFLQDAVDSNSSKIAKLIGSECNW